jgi:hypothetical protein
VYYLHEIHTGIGQNNGNTTHTAHFFINMVLDHLLSSIQPQSLEWTRKSFEQSVAEFYTILLEGTSSSCFRDVGDGNLFLTLVSKTGSMMFRSGDCAGQGRC